MSADEQERDVIGQFAGHKNTLPAQPVTAAQYRLPASDPEQRWAPLYQQSLTPATTARLAQAAGLLGSAPFTQQMYMSNMPRITNAFFVDDDDGDFEVVRLFITSDGAVKSMDRLVPGADDEEQPDGNLWVDISGGDLWDRLCQPAPAPTASTDFSGPITPAQDRVISRFNEKFFFDTAVRPDGSGGVDALGFDGVSDDVFRVRIDKNSLVTSVAAVDTSGPNAVWSEFAEDDETFTDIANDPMSSADRARVTLEIRAAQAAVAGRAAVQRKAEINAAVKAKLAAKLAAKKA